MVTLDLKVTKRKSLVDSFNKIFNTYLYYSAKQKNALPSFVLDLVLYLRSFLIL